MQRIEIERFSVISSRPFETVVAAIEAAVSHPDMAIAPKSWAAAKDWPEAEAAIRKAIGNADFMEFARFDLGAVLRRESGRDAPRILRLVIGNPLIMKEMVKHVPDAGSYAPVTILIDERADGVHLSWDRMASFLAPYGSEAALQVARELDAKVEDLLTRAAA
jgi:uncharacterized protein (DUF302 family)